MEEDWPTYTLKYEDESGAPGEMELPLTFADFAVTEGRFRKQFRTVPRDAWNDNMVPLAEYLTFDADEREGKFPYIWAVDRKNRLIRVIPAEPLVRSCEDRRHFWRTLKSLAGIRPAVDTEAIAEQARSEFAQSIAAQLLDMAANGAILTAAAAAGLPPRLLPLTSAAPAVAKAAPAAVAPAPNGDAPSTAWIETAMCTSCDECTRINNRISPTTRTSRRTSRIQRAARIATS